MSKAKLPRRPLSERNPYHLDEFREKEIVYFCYQYDSWKKRLKDIKFIGGTDEWSDPTSKEAIDRINCEQKMKIVENACKRAYPKEWELLLEGVTNPDANFTYLKMMRGFKCGRDRYYSLKHQVYFYVAQVRV